MDLAQWGAQWCSMGPGWTLLVLSGNQGFAEARGTIDRAGSLYWDEKLGCAEVG